MQGSICVCSRECMHVCGFVVGAVGGVRRPDGALYSGEWRSGQKSGTGWLRKRDGRVGGGFRAWVVAGPVAAGRGE